MVAANFGERPDMKTNEDIFEEQHAKIEKDCLAEMKRRCQLWAAAPPSRGIELNSVIVPISTIFAAIDEIEASRKKSA